MTLRVAGAQMMVRRDVRQNVATLCEAIEAASSAGADLLLTPEGSLSGYTHRFDANAVSDGLEQVTRVARAHSLGLALGTCFVETDGKCYNQLRFYRSDGTYLGFHSKILRCGSLDTPSQGEINHYAASALSTFSWSPPLCIGGLICNDLWANPECTPMPDAHLTHQISGLGAQIVFHAVNGGRDGSAWSELVWHYHEANLRMRARASGLWIVTVDNCHPVDQPCSAPSGVITPEGMWACRTDPQGSQFFTYTIDLP